jgi:hypothetical protein
MRIGMVGAIGFEFTRKRSFNNIERTAGTVKQGKAVVSSANGSQTDHDQNPPDWAIDTRPDLALPTALDVGASNSFNFVPEHASELRALRQTPLTDGGVELAAACGDSQIDPSSLRYSRYSAKSFLMTRRAMHAHLISLKPVSR